MTNRQGFLEYDTNKKIERFFVFDKKTSNITFVPEVGSTEDMQVLSLYGLVLDEGTPIMVRSNYWDSFISSIDFSITSDKKNKFLGLSSDILVNRHSFLFYEPPEFFQLMYHKNLIHHSVGSDKLILRKFKAEVKKLTDKDKISKVLGLLPRFYRPFVEKQFLQYLLFKSKEDKKNGEDFSNVIKNLFNDKELEKRPDISKVWYEDRIDAAYPIHIADLLLEANKANKAKNSALIPPVPELSRSSNNSDIDLVKDFNLSASAIRNTSLGPEYPQVYFHLYLDWKMMQPKSSGLNASSLLPVIEKTIEEGDFAGICLTIKGYEKATKEKKFGYIESFVTDLSSLAGYYYLPIILPRSKLYGLKLLDSSINCFGSLFNGRPVCPKATLGFKASEKTPDGEKTDTHFEYGYTYIINKCIELDYDETKKYLEQTKEFPNVPYLQKTVTETYWKDAKLYRMHVSKARRLSHMEESRMVRKGRKDNVINPAARYLEKSNSPDFGCK